MHTVGVAMDLESALGPSGRTRSKSSTGSNAARDEPLRAVVDRVEVVEGQVMRLTDGMGRVENYLGSILAWMTSLAPGWVPPSMTASGTMSQPAAMPQATVGQPATLLQSTEGQPAAMPQAMAGQPAALPQATVGQPAPPPPPVGLAGRKKKDRRGRGVQSPVDSESDSEGRHVERFAQRNSFNSTWTNKQAGPTGAQLLGTSRRPFKDPGFGEFVKNRILSGREPLMSPLENRVEFLRTDPFFMGVFRSYAAFLGTGVQPLPPALPEPEGYPTDAHRQHILHNLVAMYFITRDEQCPLDLMTMLAIFEAGPGRAWTMPNFALRELDVVSLGALRLLHGREPWLGHMFPNGIAGASENGKRFAAGLSLMSADQFRRCVRDQTIPGEPTLSLGALSTLGAPSAVSHQPVNFQNHQLALPQFGGHARGRPNQARSAMSAASYHRSVSQVAAPASPQAAAPASAGAPTARHTNDLFRGRVTGPHYVGDRCLLCAQRGHRKDVCPNPTHEKFDPANPYALLDGVSHGRPGYPSPTS